MIDRLDAEVDQELAEEWAADRAAAQARQAGQAPDRDEDVA